MSDWFDGAGNGSRLDLSDVLDSGALDTLVAVVDSGALVSLGLTSDGGALGITVTLDGRWRREYVRGGADAGTFLGAALAAVRSDRQPPASSGPASRSRRSRARS